MDGATASVWSTHAHRRPGWHPRRTPGPAVGILQPHTPTVPRGLSGGGAPGLLRRAPPWPTHAAAAGWAAVRGGVAGAAVMASGGGTVVVLGVGAGALSSTEEV